MTIIKEVKPELVPKNHYCHTPKLEPITQTSAGAYGEGTIFQCDICGKKWIVCVKDSGLTYKNLWWVRYYWFQNTSWIIVGYIFLAFYFYILLS